MDKVGTTGGQVSNGLIVGHASGSEKYTTQVFNTSDNSERLRIIHSAKDAGIGGSTHTHTWINVTTGHTRADLIGLAGTVVLSYDISGPAGDMSSTDINVFISDRGSYPPRF